MTAALHILESGMMASLQDSGRWGYQRFGVPVSGALDQIALTIANLLVDNPADTAAIEIMGGGLAFRVDAPSIRIAVAGASPPFRIENGKSIIRVPSYQSATAVFNDIVRVASPGNAAVYLALQGGFAVPPVLGSRSAYSRAKLGGAGGRALKHGDRLPLSLAEAQARKPLKLDVSLAAPPVLRIMRGPDSEAFASEAIDTLVSSAYTVSPASDRMGLRLPGPQLLRNGQREPMSQGTTAGALQVPPDGQPILLLNDRQTTGGYPRIATVIGADMAGAGRLRPGMKIRFQEVTRDEAIAALAGQRAWLAGLPARLSEIDVPLSAEHLLQNNLIGGITAGSSDDQL